MTEQRELSTPEWKQWLVILFTIGMVVLAIVVLLWPFLSREQTAVDKALSELEAATAERTAALDELEIAVEASFQAELLAWSTVSATLDQAWRLTWNNDAPPLATTTTYTYPQHQCWHISELDSQVDDVPFEVWRCEFVGESCDRRFNILCIDTASDGVSWEFRFDEEIGTLQFN